MIIKETKNNELYVYIIIDGIKSLLYKRWLNLGYGMVMDRQPFTAKDTEQFKNSKR